MNRISYEDRRKVYLRALIKFGEKAQQIVAVEELSEAQKEVCKCLRGQGKLEHLAEEIADAQIMLEQVQEMYGIGPWVEDYMDKKIERLDRRIKGEEE